MFNRTPMQNFAIKKLPTKKSNSNQQLVTKLMMTLNVGKDDVL